jgi:hypothetical protein
MRRATLPRNSPMSKTAHVLHRGHEQCIGRFLVIKLSSTGFNIECHLETKPWLGSWEEIQTKTSFASTPGHASRSSGLHSDTAMAMPRRPQCKIEALPADPEGWSSRPRTKSSTSSDVPDHVIRRGPFKFQNLAPPIHLEEFVTTESSHSSNATQA